MKQFIKRQSPPKNEASESEVQQEVQANLIRLGPQVLFSSILVAMIFYIAGLSVLNLFWLNLWIAVFLLLNVFRLIRIRGMNQQPASSTVYFKNRREYVAGAFLSGVVWASIVFFYNPDQPLTMQLLIITLLVGLPLSSLSANANHLGVLFAFSIPLFIALLYFSFLLSSDEPFFFLVAMVHIIITLITSMRLNNTIRENIQSHILNKMLLEEFTRVNLELENLAYFDPLTQLHNRRYFNESAKATLAELDYQNESLAFVMMDVDLFKEVNDTYGHDAGDLLLQHIANSINMTITKLAEQNALTIEAARLGGMNLAYFLSTQKTTQF
ncbi:MAG: GGDEF domain-containing protein [Thiotrichales bacterium]|nr:GGDEF domain-containing protein [Thiotrichales bacterium]